MGFFTKRDEPDEVVRLQEKRTGIIEAFSNMVVDLKKVNEEANNLSNAKRELANKLDAEAIQLDILMNKNNETISKIENIFA